MESSRIYRLAIRLDIDKPMTKEAILTPLVGGSLLGGLGDYKLLTRNIGKEKVSSINKEAFLGGLGLGAAAGGIGLLGSYLARRPIARGIASGIGGLGKWLGRRGTAQTRKAIEEAPELASAFARTRGNVMRRAFARPKQFVRAPGIQGEPIAAQYPRTQMDIPIGRSGEAIRPLATGPITGGPNPAFGTLGGELAVVPKAGRGIPGQYGHQLERLGPAAGADAGYVGAGTRANMKQIQTAQAELQHYGSALDPKRKKHLEALIAEAQVKPQSWFRGKSATPADLRAMKDQRFMSVAHEQGQAAELARRAELSRQFRQGHRSLRSVAGDVPGLRKQVRGRKLTEAADRLAFWGRTGKTRRIEKLRARLGVTPQEGKLSREAVAKATAAERDIVRRELAEGTATNPFAGPVPTRGSVTSTRPDLEPLIGGVGGGVSPAQMQVMERFSALNPQQQQTWASVAGRTGVEPWEAWARSSGLV